MDAILNVDKPLYATSHDVVRQIRRLAGLKRVGHAGTLDPLATGVLVIGLGRATRLLEYVVGQPKYYVAQIQLGQTSSTYDGEGKITEAQPVEISRSELEETLRQFEGAIQQVPPMYSAVKKDGQRLYDLARKGIEVERRPREVTIYELQVVRFSPPLLELHAVCSAGTYIRSLAHDLGQALGCGAYLSGLRRTAVGTFTVEEAVVLDNLNSSNIEEFADPPDCAVRHLPRLSLSDEAAEKLAQGQWLSRQAEEPGDPLVRAYDTAGKFVGVVSAEGAQWRPRKILYDT